MGVTKYVVCGETTFQSGSGSSSGASGMAKILRIRNMALQRIYNENEQNVNLMGFQTEKFVTGSKQKLILRRVAAATIIPTVAQPMKLHTLMYEHEVCNFIGWATVGIMVAAATRHRMSFCLLPVTNFSVWNPIKFTFCSFSLYILWRAMFRIRRILAIPDAPDEDPDPDWNVVSPQTTYLVTDVRDGNTLPWVSSMVHGFMRPGLKKLNCARPH